LILAVLLRWACKICQVEDPSFLNSWGISAVAVFPPFATSGLIWVITWVSGGTPQEAHQAVAQFGFLGVFIFIVVAASIYSVMIEISFGRALLVWLVQILLIIGIVIGFFMLYGLLLLLIARAPSGKSYFDLIEFSVRWPLIGAAVAVAVVGLFLFVVRKYVRGPGQWLIVIVVVLAVFFGVGSSLCSRQKRAREQFLREVIECKPRIEEAINRVLNPGGPRLKFKVELTPVEPFAMFSMPSQVVFGGGLYEVDSERGGRAYLCDARATYDFRQRQLDALIEKCVPQGWPGKYRVTARWDENNVLQEVHKEKVRDSIERR
jgi:hypothetical protein